MTDFLVLATILLGVGVIAVPIATRLGLGSVLGYLIAGMAISPVLGALGVDVIQLQHFAEFGVVMMLFLIGLELEPRKLWEMRSRLIGLGGGQVLVTTLLIASTAIFIVGDPWQTGLAIGMILALSSTAIILQTLDEKGLMKSEGGQSAFSVLLFQDIAVIPMLAILPLLALPDLGGAELAADVAHAGGGHAGEAGDHGGGAGSLMDGMPAWQSGLITLGAIAFVALAGNYLTRPVFRFIASAGLRELFTATALLFVTGIALLMTVVGLSPALGTFLAGVVLANSEYRHELESDIDPFKGLLLGLFFITVGAGINFSLLATQWGEVLMWTAVLVVTKLAVLWVLGGIFKISGTARWLFALSLAQAGEFGFVLLSFAVGNSVIPQDTADLLLLVVAMSMLITPLLFILYDKVILPRFDREREFDAIEESRDIIVAGRGRVGGIVDRMLETAGYRTTVIDYSSSQIERLGRFGMRVYYGDATRPDLLASAGIDSAKLLVVAIDDKEATNRLVSYVHKAYPHVHIIARAYDRNHVFELWSLGCRDIIRETYDSSLRMGRSAYEALGLTREKAEDLVRVFEDMDREMMVPMANVWDADTPPWENEEMIALVKKLRSEWDPLLRDQMDQIMGRDDLDEAAE
ncbi:glutathione-regulated potassium-efflux system protein [Erythrobacter sp. NAP1]|uniref:cation:proton antiporter domain-containing protein n=1 Tax=Erythrobacter sp. NAP1 TaxID=237727 RepID=UPI0000687718|nr:cation:proton antiporter [Erythrobacter sp. NAP1]EAQ28022.1 glutathione-regulated potassium-efflux system protein [Erythrobacter sp. NAP1]